jgi:hypothetical protein
MKRLVLTLLVSSALAVVYGDTASAQATGTTGTNSAFDPNFDAEIDGEEVNKTGDVYVTADQCQESVLFTFIARNYLVTIPVVEVWASSTADCNLAASRTTSNNNAAACWLLGTKTSVQGDTKLEGIPATKVFRTGTADEMGCPELAGTKYKVYFVPLQGPSDGNPASPPDALVGAQQLKGTFTLYSKRPEAPGGVKPLNGESRVALEWSAAANATSTTDYRAYFDTSIGADPTCANSVLKEGDVGPEPDNQDTFRTGYDKGLSAKLTDLDSKGVAIGDYVAAAVTTKDIANNNSTMSEVVCIKRVQTDGFLDVCGRDPNCKDQFQTCSLRQGTRRGALSAAGLLLLGLGIAFAIRRRRV